MHCTALQATLHCTRQAVSLGKAILEDDPDNFMLHLVRSCAVQCNVVQCSAVQNNVVQQCSTGPAGAGGRGRER